jgi:predicted methyltransferase
MLDKLLFSSLLCVAVIFAQQQKSMPPATTERPFGDRIATFERPDRVARLMPDQVVKALHLKDGDVVADVSAGTGVMTRRFAKAVAPGGSTQSISMAKSWTS